MIIIILDCSPAGLLVLSILYNYMITSLDLATNIVLAPILTMEPIANIALVILVVKAHVFRLNDLL